MAPAMGAPARWRPNLALHDAARPQFANVASAPACEETVPLIKIAAKLLRSLFVRRASGRLAARSSKCRQTATAFRRVRSRYDNWNALTEKVKRRP